MFPNFSIAETRYPQKYRVSFRLIRLRDQVFGNMGWVCLSFMSMRIPIIALMTLAASAGGELAARAIYPTFAPTQALLRKGTTESDRRDACPTRVQTEAEVRRTSR